MTLLTAVFLKKFRELDNDQLLNVLYRMVEAHPDTFVELLGVSGNRFTVPFTNQTVIFAQPELTELLSYTRDRKVTCIKRIREITGIGLKEAKDLCEAHFPSGKYSDSD